MATAGGMAIAWPLAASGQRRPRVVGIVIAAGSPEGMAGADPALPPVRMIVHRLRDLGWIEGRTIIIERRTADGRAERAPAIIAELVGAGADAIILTGADWLIEIARKMTTVPLVANFLGPRDPVALGQVASLARPGGNLTGVAFQTGAELATKRLQLLKELAPRTTRIGWLGTAQQKQVYSPDIAPAGTRLVHAVAETLDDFDQAFDLIVREGCDAMHVGGTVVHYIHRSRIIAFAARHRLPASYSLREVVADGGLMAYGANLVRMHGQMAEMVDRILRGAKPADLPIQLPDKFDLVINRKTAESLGLTVPPTLEVAAEMIE
jgi:putative ABC transport system substrate-binding protein